jgi:hypothetical protein
MPLIDLFIGLHDLVFSILLSIPSCQSMTPWKSTTGELPTLPEARIRSGASPSSLAPPPPHMPSSLASWSGQAPTTELLSNAASLRWRVEMVLGTECNTTTATGMVLEGATAWGRPCSMATVARPPVRQGIAWRGTASHYVRNTQPRCTRTKIGDVQITCLHHHVLHYRVI